MSRTTRCEIRTCGVCCERCRALCGDHTSGWCSRSEMVRMPLGCALIVGGTLGFLPVLGFWMLPIGALLIGEDIPPVKRATLRALGKAMRWWDARRMPD